MDLLRLSHHSIHCSITAYPAREPSGAPRSGECDTCGNSQGTLIRCSGLGMGHMWEFHSHMPWATYRRTQWKGKLRSNFPIPQCDLENRFRSTSRHYPTATFPWGRRQWAQPSRMCILGAHPVAGDRKSEIGLAPERELKLVHWDVSW